MERNGRIVLHRLDEAQRLPDAVHLQAVRFLPGLAGTQRPFIGRLLLLFLEQLLIGLGIVLPEIGPFLLGQAAACIQLGPDGGQGLVPAVKGHAIHCDLVLMSGAVLLAQVPHSLHFQPADIGIQAVDGCKVHSPSFLHESPCNFQFQNTPLGAEIQGILCLKFTIALFYCAFLSLWDCRNCIISLPAVPHF